MYIGKPAKGKIWYLNIPVNYIDFNNDFSSERGGGGGGAKAATACAWTNNFIRKPRIWYK